MLNSSLKDIGDQELVLRYKSQNNKDAFGELYTRYYAIVLGVCLKYLKNIEEAKDITMQIFEKVFNTIHKYEIENFGAWLYRTAKNECLMLLRKNNHQLILTENIDSKVMELDEGLHLIQEKEKNLDNMNQAIALLPAEQKKCIELFYLQKLSYSDIQEKTGYTFMQVKSYIQNAKRNLKIKLSQVE